MLRWYVTPLREPDRFVAGPYETRAEAARQCVLLTSELTKRNAAEALSMNVANYYVPRVVNVTSITEVRVTITEHRPGITNFPRPVVKDKSPAEQRKGKANRLSERLVRMTHSQLLAVAEYLDIEVNHKASRFEIINTIMRAL